MVMQSICLYFRVVSIDYIVSLVSGVLPAVIGLAGAAALLRKKDRAD